MGLEYDLSDVDDDKSLRDLRMELAPRNRCEHYVMENGGKAILVSREEFDSYYSDKKFKDGPFKDNFGDGCEPYNPHRQAFGKLDSGEVVYCELSKANKEKTERLFRLTYRTD